ncbi:MAG: XdhC family protein, partial [Candidatus Dormibacteraeota bacterium]|nr:XdhC family protein [Candidatus Dormibacteraeota bacterium]
RRLGWRADRRADAAGPATLVVHTDHDDPGLVDQLEAVLRSGVGFIGVMGSRRHTGHHMDELARRGIPLPDIARIQSPVGLDIGARSAGEIALSIMAGLVAVRNGARGGWKANGPGPRRPPSKAGPPGSHGAG